MAKHLNQYYNQHYGNVYSRNKNDTQSDPGTKKQNPNTAVKNESLKSTVRNPSDARTTPAVDAPVFPSPLDRNNLIAGIIVSEILGKPKAIRKGW